MTAGLAIYDTMQSVSYLSSTLDEISQIEEISNLMVLCLGMYCHLYPPGVLVR